MHLSSTNNARWHRRHKVETDLRRILGMELREYISKHLLTESALNVYIEHILNGESNPYQVVMEIINSLNRDKS